MSLHEKIKKDVESAKVLLSFLELQSKHIETLFELFYNNKDFFNGDDFTAGESILGIISEKLKDLIYESDVL